jgi:exopolysaccharide production protein ExoZ
MSSKSKLGSGGAPGEFMVENELPEAPALTVARVECLIPPKQLDGIQILRGVAASMVVFHHFCLMLNEYGGHSRVAQYHNLGLVGAAGVDIFFVISGFIIVYTMMLRERPITWPQFALARIKRVVPLYWLFTLLLVGIWVTHKALKSMVVTPDLLIRSLFFLPLTKYTLGAAPSSHPILVQGWTLQYEAFFYLLCTLVIAILGVKKLFPFVSIAVVLSMVAARLIPSAPNYLSDPLLLEFVAGTILGWLAATGLLAGLAHGRVLAWLAISGATVALFLTSFLTDPFSARVWGWGIPGVLLVFGSILVKPSRSGILARPAIYIGSASYSIYLGHGLVTLFAGTLMKGGYLTGSGDGFLFLATVGTIAATSLVYPMLEKPINRSLR